MDTQDVLDTAKRVAVLLEDSNAEITATGVLPPPLLDRLKGDRLFRMMQPKLYGGMEIEPEIFFEVQMLLSGARMSAGWLVGILGLQAWQLSLMPPEAQSDVWDSKPDSIICSSFMPAGRVERVAGGYVLSGHWRFSSGSLHSDWALLGGIVPAVDGEPPDYCAFLVPRSDYRVEPDWDAVGMRATQSDSVVVEGARVPGYRIFRAVEGFQCDNPGNRLHSNPIYRIPFGQLFGLTIALPMVGALETSIEYCKAAGGRKLPSGAEDPRMQRSLTNAAAAARLSRLVASTNLGALRRIAEAGSVPSTDDRIRMRFETASIADRCVRAINDLFLAHGTRSVMSSSKVTQTWLDMNAANLHAGNNVGRFGANYADSLYGKPVTELLI